VRTASERHHQGQAYLQQRKVQLAAREFEEALRLGLDPFEGIGDRWTAWMLLGEIERAWQETDRIESKRRRGISMDGQLIWDGTSVDDRVVLLRYEHGLGDAIQFVRYVPLLRRQCSRLIAKARLILIPLLRTFAGIDAVISDGEPDPPFDVQMEGMELPYVFRTTLHTIPAEVPYIHLNDLSAPRDNGGELNIGLAWASGPWNNARSMPLAALRSLIRIPNVSFQSLQWGPESKQAFIEAGFNFRNPFPPPEDLIATAEAIRRCDLVVSVDTMVAHLAGALGKPVWLLLAFDSDWRWMTDRRDSPWYPTMRIFRQNSPGDWSTPVEEIASELRNNFEHTYGAGR
jgi:hypothetical protein